MEDTFNNIVYKLYAPKTKQLTPNGFSISTPDALLINSGHYTIIFSFFWYLKYLNIFLFV